MSANDDYPWALREQQYQKIRDEVDELREKISQKELEIDELRAEVIFLKNDVETYREMDDDAGKEIERLTDFNKRLLEQVSDMVGVGPGYPLTEFSVQDVDPEIVNLLIEGGYYERSSGDSVE